MQISLLIAMYQTEWRSNFDIVIAVHSTSVIWSILYHLFPGIRTNSIYRYLSQTISNMFWILAIMNICLLFVAISWGSLVLGIFLIYFTGPAAFVGATFVIMVNSDDSDAILPRQNQYVVYFPISDENIINHTFHRLV